METKIARKSTIRRLQQLKESEHQLDCQSYVEPHQDRCGFGGIQDRFDPILPPAFIVSIILHVSETKTSFCQLCDMCAGVRAQRDSIEKPSKFGLNEFRDKMKL